MPLTIPPYRAALLTGADGAPMVRANGPASEPVLTEKQWYLFWQDLAGALNDGAQTLEALGDMLTFGNHADRPNPGPWPDGALYVEQDRGSVLYQNQGGVWQYIAGTMYGTLSPDQRPADLNAAQDAGFQFRTNTDPARAFAWSGTAWIETTPVRFGTHAERLAETIANLVSGMMWMETDRGNVIYQLQTGAWLYLSGEMWGTLSPDERPTDLGVNDTGFHFVATVSPMREFIWASSLWVETSAFLDPTTTKGDLIARGSAAPATRLPVGANGQVLTADSTQALGVKWNPAASGDVSGGAALTHPNVVTKVGAAGQIVEGGITDASAGNSGFVQITASGNVGIGTAPSRIFHVKYPGGFGSGPAIQGSTQSYLQLLSASGGAGFGIGRSVATDGQDFWIYDAVAGQFRMNITAAGNMGLGNLTGPIYLFQLPADSAAKPVTSTWSVPSDIALKQNVEPVNDDSLTILEKLDWIRYEYNGLANMPKGAKGIGLVAQALREVMPEAVRSTKGKLRETDADETDVLAIDYHYVLVHSARAIQQLSAEVNRLGALIPKPGVIGSQS